ncbi:hypothetical protein [Calditerricola satsumensis]|uniref:hypothetical protein n=1 Tax=Calditerricola satsumensis TaxID=373054 RepID=UPI0006D21891|nr:hypothetical protein [Calditerricola satsumensis]
MSWNKLKNCPECGRVFVAYVATVCPDCQKKIDEEYQRCVDFLRQRQNRMATLAQLSAGTGVSVKRITQFIREGRLSLAEHPNLGYPCDRCGASSAKGACVRTACPAWPTCGGSWSRKPSEQATASFPVQAWGTAAIGLPASEPARPAFSFSSRKGDEAKTRLRRSMGEGTGARARLRTTKGNEEASETRK